jgi:hypothetical protein
VSTFREHDVASANSIFGGLLPHGVVTRGLVLTSGFTALSAIGGGVGLLAPGSMGLPLSFLDGSIFTSYAVPGMLLLLVIGGTQCVAAIAALRRTRLASFWSALAAVALLVWVFVELAIMGDFSAPHGVYFAIGVLELVLVLLLLGVLPRVVRRRSDGTGSTDAVDG